MPWRDVAHLLEQAAEWRAQEIRDSENVAMLVDRDDFYLNSEYSSWITDPDDPDVKAAQARRKKSKVKPPPAPLLRPVAQREPIRMVELVKRYHAELEKHAIPEKPKDVKVTSARELARLMGWGA
ncbi:hypothetical protein DW322_11300 [Rhodococcus rhodnii]|uniref:Uncharacterized protein n=2 Tax=Rhodococcus rhodnii TaxID=38312 RepID=R7WS08_9NOCA|nr:hypothetical protein [Rhodococcus rhodnii]EOM78096.1 hypothetical protein Rrhod_0546 [Rhodococcus rhodnii LMG 5362]TXG90697.1 hypothetical protein DW322_11300 [Rhodococcus rhodnii]